MPLVAALFCSTVLSAQVADFGIVDAAAFQPRAASDMRAGGFTPVIEVIFKAAVSTPLPTELAANMPLDEDDVTLGPGTIAITLVDAEGARGNTAATQP